MSNLGNKEVFSRNLKRYMAINNKVRNEICEALKIPYTTFTDWEKGNIYPRIDKIEMLANYFKIQKSDLIEEKYDIFPENNNFAIDPAARQLLEERKILASKSSKATLEQLKQMNKIMDALFGEKDYDD
jgi:transcriptional regulator with XRE-family HTH domain